MPQRKECSLGRICTILYLFGSSNDDSLRKGVEALAGFGASADMVAVKQEERCQVVVCRHGQDLSSGAKFVLKPGDSVRIGRGRGNEAEMKRRCT